MKFMSLASIVLLLGWMFYFFVGGLPLLLLKHDNPVDSRFVRNFFNIHYLVLMGLAGVGTLSFAFFGNLVLTAAIGCIALAGFAARAIIVTRMGWLRSSMSTADVRAIRQFRRLHVSGLALDLSLLGGFLAVVGVSSFEKILIG